VLVFGDASSAISDGSAFQAGDGDAVRVVGHLGLRPACALLALAALLVAALEP
jgi:hypothetical protein